MLRDALKATLDVGMDASANDAIVHALRNRLENFAQRLALDRHYARHPDVRPSHLKHKRLLSFLDELNQRSRRRASRTEILVPVAVRIEAGWDRTEPASAHANRISRARDVVLDSRQRTGPCTCAER